MINVLLISDIIQIPISSDDNHFKVWNINNFQCLLDLKGVNIYGCLTSACFINDNNNIYVLSSNTLTYKIRDFLKTANPIQVFNLKGKLIKK